MKGKSKQFALFVHSSLDTKKREILFNDIWEEYYPKLTVYLNTTYPEADTEDLVQDIMLKVYNNLSRYNPLYSFNTWIYSIARNCAVDSFRKKSSSNNLITAVRSELVSKFVNDSENPENLSLKREEKTGIAEWIQNLPERERKITFLKFYEDLTYREISRIMGIPVGTIKYLVHKIKKNIETSYNKQYGESYGS